MQILGKRDIRRIALNGVASLIIWLSFSLMGFGLALKEYAVRDRAALSIHQFGGKYQTVTGRISSIRKPFLWLEPRIQVDGKNDEFIVPLDLIDSSDPLSELLRQLKEGDAVRAHYREEDKVIVGLFVRWGTPTVKELIRGVDYSPPRLAKRTFAVEERGAWVVKVGMALLIGGILLLVFRRKVLGHLETLLPPLSRVSRVIRSRF